MRFLGFSAVSGCALALAIGCGGSVSIDPALTYDDAGNPIVDAVAVDAKTDTRPRRDSSPWTDSSVSEDDAEPDAWIDPGCPDTPAPKPVYTCDPLSPPPGDCKAGEACHPYVEYPIEPCEHERYHAECFPAGTGKQGDPCGGGACSAGFACVASGAGNVCVRMCAPGKTGGCPDGLVCHPTDVPGVGGCF